MGVFVCEAARCSICELFDWLTCADKTSPVNCCNQGSIATSWHVSVRRCAVIFRISFMIVMCVQFRFESSFVCIDLFDRSFVIRITSYRLLVLWSRSVRVLRFAQALEYCSPVFLKLYSSPGIKSQERMIAVHLLCILTELSILAVRQSHSSASW